MNAQQQFTAHIDAKTKTEGDIALLVYAWVAENATETAIGEVKELIEQIEKAVGCGMNKVKDIWQPSLIAAAE